MHSPKQGHFDVVNRILRHLKGTPRKGNLYENKGHAEVDVFTNADWVGSVKKRRLTSGYCTFCGWNLLTWCSKNQNAMARSNVEAEFRAVAHNICEFVGQTVTWRT